MFSRRSECDGESEEDDPEGPFGFDKRKLPVHRLCSSIEVKKE